MASSANRIDGRDVFRKENRFEKSREKLGGRPACALVLPLAAAVFVVESIVVALTYSLGWRNGFALQLNTDPSGTFWPLLALAAAPAALAIIVLADVAARLRIGLVARWDAEDRYPHAEPPRAFGRPRTGWGDVGLAMGAILFFSEAITVTVALASSYGSGFSLLVAFNAYGEFWVEFPLVVAALPLAVLALRLSLAPVRQAMRHRSHVRRLSAEPRLQHWLLATSTRPVPARRWIPSAASEGRSGPPVGLRVSLIDPPIARRTGLGGERGSN